MSRKQRIACTKIIKFSHCYQCSAQPDK